MARKKQTKIKEKTYTCIACDTPFIVKDNEFHDYRFCYDCCIGILQTFNEELKIMRIRGKKI